MNSTLSTNEMARLIHDRHRTLSELRIVAARQFKVIEDQELSRLLELLAIKQGLINRLVEYDRALDPFRQQSPEERVWASEELREQCRLMIEESSQWLDDVKRLETAAESLAQQQRSEVSELVDTAAHRARAVSAYLNANKSPQRQTTIHEG